MFLFGEEVGAEQDFVYGQVLEFREDLKALRHGTGKYLFKFYQDVIQLRLKNEALKSQNIEVVYTHNSNRIIAFRRWNESQNYLIVASLSNLPFDDPGYFIESSAIPHGRWQEVFNSDSANYWGWNVGNAGGILYSSDMGVECAIPAIGVLVFELVE